MGPTHADTTGWKRLVTAEGQPVGWARRGDGEDGDGEGDADEWHAKPNPGLLRGCDSWIAPSWHEGGRYRLDPDAVVGEGEATVVLAAADSDADSLLEDARGTEGRGVADDRSGSEHDKPHRSRR
ncbi:hypothetical protein [Halobaculum magnesiiphilum]|uniref:Uncharacterized protein n=1 Tax=Halobaculum magnesiiphilum TaxID=1017351 RepID=A0A8T8WIU1_9EURY|nr:hypothetical protein [Halobaculum magnesiiphilum]QZP39750.1 hypothetical protein K6T50_17400 [Halobaculum magnesiiphilum]